MQKFGNLVSKRKLMFSQLLVIAALFSCKKESFQNESLLLDQPQQELAMSTSTTGYSSSNLLFEETFEGSSPLSTYVSRQFETAHAFTVAGNMAYQGSKSGRFELRDGDPLNNDGTRTEISFPYQSTLHRWYSFAAYFPSADYLIDESDEVLAQWHQSGGYSPSISIRGKNDRFRLIVKPKTDVSEKIDLGLIPKDQWNNIVFHINHSSKSDGLIEIWINGKKVYNRVGINMYDISSGDVKAPKWKLGIYKSDWNGSQTTDATKRVIFFDNIRLGNENATYAEMSSNTGTGTSGGTETPTPTTTSPVVNSLTLVNAATQADIKTLTEGTSVDLAEFANAKFNIRANSTTSLGSVKFELTGTENKNVLDNSLPFTLQGDANGVYDFGNWNPPAVGNYTIKATPYSGASGAGTAGTPYTINFTFTKTAEVVAAPSELSFTLVSAHTEKDLMPLTNGSQVSISQIPVPKLNIRANTPSNYKSVMFELTGTQSKLVKDNTLPFTLNGDSGTNYGFGSWDPPALGTYTLKATPYTGLRLTGTAGAPYSISFSFVK